MIIIRMHELLQYRCQGQATLQTSGVDDILVKEATQGFVNFILPVGCLVR